VSETWSHWGAANEYTPLAHKLLSSLSLFEKNGNVPESLEDERTRRKRKKKKVKRLHQSSSSLKGKRSYKMNMMTPSDHISQARTTSVKGGSMVISSGAA